MSAKRISLLALFLALSVIGASLKIPAAIGSVALDLFPALLAAIFLGRMSGMIVASFGHILSALIVGMPLGPIHIMIALEMAVIVWVFQFIYDHHRLKLAGFFVIMSNTFIAPIPMFFLFDMNFYIAVLPSLFVGSIVNTVVSIWLAPKIEGIFNKVLVNE